MPLIHRIKIFRLLPDLTTEQVVAFRMCGDQLDCEAFGHLWQTRWMEQNPGHATIMVTDWPTSEELGGQRSPAPRPEHWTGR